LNLRVLSPPSLTSWSLLSFHRCAHRRCLHAFPTRRSSDLGDDRVAIVGRNNPRWVIAYIAVVTYGSTAVPIMQDFDANDINHIIDRKSTRLNSSHVSISYAVFCLKKKKTNTSTAPSATKHP